MNIVLSEFTMDIARDANGVVRHLGHIRQPIFPGQPEPPQDPHGLAEEYLQSVAEIYDIDPATLQNTSAAIASIPEESGNDLRIAIEKSAFGTTLVQYAQTYFGLPIWEAGVGISIAEDPPRVTSSTSTVHYDVVVAEVSQQALQNLEQPDMSGWLRTVLNLPEEGGVPNEPVINGTQLRIYQYVPD